MSTSILYHAFGLRGIEYRATRFEGEYIVFEAEMTTRNIPCPACNNEKVIFKGNKWREFLMPTKDPAWMNCCNLMNPWPPCIKATTNHYFHWYEIGFHTWC